MDGRSPRRGSFRLEFLNKCAQVEEFEKSSIIPGVVLSQLRRCTVSFTSACLLTLLACCAIAQDKIQASLTKDPLALPEPTPEQNLALETLNGFRAIHGLEPVKIDRRLIAASAHHVGSMTKTRELAHKETSRDTQDALARAQTYGFDGPVAELIASGVPSAPFAVVSFMDAPYHRRLLLKPGQFSFGCSVDSGFACFVLGGQVQQRLVYSPPNGSEGVPTWWDGREEPSPMRGTSAKPPYGYPIMVAAYGYEDDLNCTQATLVDPSGSTIECAVKQPKNDSEAKNSIVIVPLKPLAGETLYTVCAKFTLEGVSHVETWSFRTGESDVPAPRTKSRKRKG